MGILSSCKNILKAPQLSARNRRDLWHVFVPFVLAVVMAPGSLSGAALFLMAWYLLRGGVSV